MVYPLKIEFNVPAIMRDGIVLRANIFQPDAPGSFPVAVLRTPYGKDFATANPFLDAVRLAREGYIVVVQDCRGRFNSGGEWFPFRYEGQDGYDTVEWAATLPGSNGRVGMFGASYSGFTQWSTAMQGAPHLHALMPTITWADVLDGTSWRGGAFELGVSAFWNLSNSFDVFIRRYHDSSPLEMARAIGGLVRELNQLRARGYWSLPLAEFAPMKNLGIGDELFFESIAHPNEQESAAPYSPASAYERLRVPAFNVGGWYDIFQKGTLENFSALRTRGSTPEARQARLLMGPWSHLQYGEAIGDMDFGFGANMQFINVQTDLTGLTTRWFDYWLKGIENGVTREPPVKLFIMGDNVWRDENEWPLARARYTDYYLRAEGRLATTPPAAEEPDHYIYNPENPVPTTGGAFLMSPLYHPGVHDQRAIEARADVLSYTSEPLTQPTEVTGPITVKLWAASDARDTDFVARLVDVHPDGFAQNLTDGIIRARYRNGGVAEWLEPEQPYEFTIDLWATANVFQVGHRIRLDVTSSNFPRWDRNLNTGSPFGTDATFCKARQTILHDQTHRSRVTLPIVPR